MSVPLTASDRLALSRERLRQSLRDSSASKAPSTEQRMNGATAPWLAGLKSIPGASVVIETLSRWWSQQPLRTTGEALADTARAVLQPLAQRNPMGLVLGAAAVGGLLVWIRPWRWVPKTVLLAGLLPQLLSTAVAHLPSTPWMALLSSLSQRKRQAGEPTV